MLKRSVYATLMVAGMLAACSRNVPAGADESGTAGAASEVVAGEGAGEEASGGTAAEHPAGPTVYLVRDSGVRCMAAPCPTYVAKRADKPQEEPLQVHELDLSPMNLSAAQSEKAMQALQVGDGLRVEATVEVQPKAGPAGDATVLRVTRLP